MLTATCECGKSYGVDDKHAGRALKCKQCGKMVRIPAAALPVAAYAAPAADEYVMATPAAPSVQPSFSHPAGPVAAAVPVTAAIANPNDPFGAFADLGSSAPAAPSHTATSTKRVKKKSEPAMPGWAWIFVGPCIVIPIISLGGLLPVIIASVGISGIMAAVRQRQMSLAARVGLCIAITGGCWSVFLVLLFCMAFAMATGVIPNPEDPDGFTKNWSSSSTEERRSTMSSERRTTSSGERRTTSPAPKVKSPAPAIPDSPSKPFIDPAPSRFEPKIEPQIKFQPPPQTQPQRRPEPPPQPVGPTPITSVGTALAALSEENEGRQQEALRWIDQLPSEKVSQADAKQILAEVGKRLDHKNWNMREPLIKIYVRYAGPSEVDRLAEIMQSTQGFDKCWGPAIVALVKLDVARATTLLEQRIDELNFRFNVVYHLHEIKGVKEETIWTMLKSKNALVVENAVGILGELGSEKSIAPINQAYESRTKKEQFFLKRHVDSALAKIRARGQ